MRNHSGNCIGAGVFGFVGVFGHKNGVKRNVKRDETRLGLGETTASIFEVARFMLPERCFIGERRLKRHFVSRFKGVDVKCETKPVLVKRA
jgi:hypothetical protein